MEKDALVGMLDRSTCGHGCVAGVVGPAGIGKSRVVREVAAVAADRGVDVFWTFCESHAAEIPFHAATRLLRAATGVGDLDDQRARSRVRIGFPDADPEDLLLLDDVLGISDPDVCVPRIDPDARRRRLTALINAASLARTGPAVYIIEDAHWIDDASESMLADFIGVAPRTPSLVIVTYRPEYRGALSTVAGAQTIVLSPLSDPETSALIRQLVGSADSVAGVTGQIAQHARGNPFFAEEIVRDLVERRLLVGSRGDYSCRTGITEFPVPVTLQATIAARIDRLGAAAKHTLNAAAVIGSRFSRELLDTLVDSAALAELVNAELVDQVTFTPNAEYAFRHPLIRVVAYESQLKADRAELHRRLAAVIEGRGCNDEDAALIGEHLESAGDLRGAYTWHMRAAAWLSTRGIVAARASWVRARQVADRLPADDPGRTAMRVAPRTLLCGTAWRVGGDIADIGFDELRRLCAAAGDRRSLAVGMAGLVHALSFRGHNRESALLATEHVGLLTAIDDPTLTIALSFAATYAKHEVAQLGESLRLAQRVIDLADGDPTTGNVLVGSPLAWALVWRGASRWAMGNPDGVDDLDRAVAISRGVDPIAFTGALVYKHIGLIAFGGRKPDVNLLREAAEALAVAEKSGDDFTLILAQLTSGVALFHHGGAARPKGLQLLAAARGAAARERFVMVVLPIVDIHLAVCKADAGDVDGAIELAQAAIDALLASGEMMWRGLATIVLVKALLRRGSEPDVQNARAAIERLQAEAATLGLLVCDLALVRAQALMARADGDEIGYRRLAERYRRMVTPYGFEPDLATVEAMT